MNRLESKLKTENLRLTSARKIIFQILQNSPKALSAQEICHKVQSSSGLKADQASVYRNLHLFSKIGLAHQLQSGKYSACSHHEESCHKHLHIVANCSVCGNTYEKHDGDLSRLAGRLVELIDDFEAISDINLQGTCKKCSNKSSLLGSTEFV